VWEDAWRASSGERAVFLQGLIQIAAGFLKWQRGQPRGMTALLDKGQDKLQRVGPRFERVKVKELLDALGAWRGRNPESTGGSPEDPACRATPRLVRQP
jgi:predicted metal-dependent hydrolase